VIAFEDIPRRREVQYSGRVQGVGFRYTVLGIARRHHVTGYVRNLPDGRVQLVAEGLPGELNRFLADVSEAMSGNIRDTDIQESEALGEFSRFEVRH
jgi:acylphosphatase